MCGDPGSGHDDGADSNGSKDADGGSSGEVSAVLPRPPRVRRRRALPRRPVLGPMRGLCSGRPVCVSRDGTGCTGPASGPWLDRDIPAV